MRQAFIYKDASNNPTHPWFYTVEHNPPGEDAFDYGSVATLPEAFACVKSALLERSKATAAARPEFKEVTA